MQKLLLATVALLAAGTAQAQSNAEPYRAEGRAPAWTATIDSRNLRFERPGAKPVVVARPRPIMGFNGERYVTRQLTIDITHAPCVDATSGRRYRDTVAVTIGRRSWHGCGGERRGGSDSVIAGNWRVVAINDRPALPDPAATIMFESERVRGDSGCNAFGGSFSFDRGRLTTGPLMSTRRACLTPAANVQERALIAFFGERASVSQGQAGKLVLTTRSGGRLVLAPADPR